MLASLSSVKIGTIDGSLYLNDVSIYLQVKKKKTN